MLAAVSRGKILDMRLQAALVALSLLPPLVAQGDRYELGLRLRAFERELATTKDQDARRAAFAELNRAVQKFFSMDMRGVATAVEEAVWALRKSAPTADERFARSLQLQFQARMAPTSDGTLAFTVLPAYPAERPATTKYSIQVGIAGEPFQPIVDTELGALPWTSDLPLRGLPPGDHTVRWRIQANGKELVVREQGLSLAKDLTARLALLVARDEAERERSTMEAATERFLVRLLQSMQKQRPEETILPGNRLLLECEALAKLAEGATFYDRSRTGQFWLQVPTGKSTATVRLVVPANVEKATSSVPLVLALHGAGGSENLFCDGYGDGAIVPLCAQRGWILCTPRVNGFASGDLPALIDALATRYPIDKDRVFILGHSMGAMATVTSVMKSPSRFAAAAPISGGGGVRKSEALSKLPFFVAAGGTDFGKDGSASLQQQLLKAGVTSTYHEYPDVEHLAVVQVALPDVFAFFDEHAKR